MNKFYVYVYLDPRKEGEYNYGGLCFNAEPFYVGKGSGYRCNVGIKDDKNYIIAIENMLKDYKEYEYEYESIFPVKLSKFDNIQVYIPNKVDEVCKYSYGGYPPPLPPINKRICHEGNIDPITPTEKKNETKT